MEHVFTSSLWSTTHIQVHCCRPLWHVSEAYALSRHHAILRRALQHLITPILQLVMRQCALALLTNAL